MADYTNSKPSVGATYPVNAVDSVYQRLEPLITPDQLKAGFLFGIPLTSLIRDPLTNKPQTMTNPMIETIINRAVDIVETEIGIDVFPTQYKEKKAFDAAEYRSYGCMRTYHRPVQSIELLSVTPSNGDDIYTVPPDWIETSSLQMGQIWIVPLTLVITNGGIVNTQSAGGSVFLSILENRPWVPAFWQITYTTGFQDGLIPRIMNELIGTIAAIEILSMVGATYGKVNTISLNMDGLGQSIGTPGPNVFAVRIGELKEKRDNLYGKVRNMYNLSIFSGNI